MNSKIKEILFWTLILVSIIMFLWKLFGNSPTTDLILIPLNIAMLIKMWSQGEDITVLKVKFENFEKQFISLAKDFKEHLRNH